MFIILRGWKQLVDLYLLCGMAFSGKTTLAAVLARHVRALVVSLDEINASRGLYGGVGIPESEWARTHHEALRQVETALGAGRSVIVDDTNCFRFLRDNYRAVAAVHGARTTVVYLDRPLELLLDRLRENEKTNARAPVTETVFLELARTFEPPDPDENVLLCPPGVPVELWVARHIREWGIPQGRAES